MTTPLLFARILPTIIVAAFAVHGRAQTLDPLFDPGAGVASGAVNVMKTAPGGGVFVGGQFSAFDGESRSGLVKLDANGAVDPWMAGEHLKYNSGPAQLMDMVIDDDGADPGIIVTGFITSHDDGSPLTRNGIAKLELGTGALVTSFSSNGGFSAISGHPRLPGCIAHQEINGDDLFLVGGDFAGYDGNTSNYLVRLDENGDYDGSFNVPSDINGVVTAIHVLENGNIAVAGDFVGPDHLYVLEPDGDLTTTDFVDIGYANQVRVISWLEQVPNTDHLLVGGEFEDPSNHLMMVDLTTGDEVATNVFDADPAGDVTDGTVLADGHIVVVGAIGSVAGETRKGIVVLNATGTVATAWDPGGGFDALMEVRDVEFVDDVIFYAGGKFTEYDGTTRNMAARLSMSECVSDCDDSDPNTVYTVQTTNGCVVAECVSLTIQYAGDPEDVEWTIEGGGVVRSGAGTPDDATTDRTYDRLLPTGSGDPNDAPMGINYDIQVSASSGLSALTGWFLENEDGELILDNTDDWSPSGTVSSPGEDEAPPVPPDFTIPLGMVEMDAISTGVQSLRYRDTGGFSCDYETHGGNPLNHGTLRANDPLDLPAGTNSYQYQIIDPDGTLAIFQYDGGCNDIDHFSYVTRRTDDAAACAGCPITTPHRRYLNPTHWLPQSKRPSRDIWLNIRVRPALFANGVATPLANYGQGLPIRFEFFTSLIDPPAMVLADEPPVVAPDFEVWPNPNGEDILNIRIHALTNAQHFAQVDVVDVIGRTVRTEAGVPFSGEGVTLAISTDALPPGIYNAMIRVDGDVHVMRWIRE